MEVEAKYAIPSEQLYQQLLSLDMLGEFHLLDGGSAALHDTYLDTAARTIWQAGYALRQRKKGTLFIITLKALQGGEGTVKHREELEVTIAQPAPPTHWPPSAVKERVVDLIGAQDLQPLFELHQLRHERQLISDEHPVCMISLDAVTLSDTERSTRFFVVEAELLPQGTEKDLEAVMHALEDSWKLQPDTGTKLQRALAFFALEMPDFAEARLTPAERSKLTVIAAQPTLYGRRAQALLLLDDGVTQIETAKQAQMSERRVRYWLAEWRQKRLGIFPEKVLAMPLAFPKVAAQPAVETGVSSEPMAAPESSTENVTLQPEIVDPLHTQAVVERAGQLFDLLQPWHGLTDDDRTLMCRIAQTHDIGVNINPEQHDAAGYEVLTTQPPVYLAKEEAPLAALAVLLHSRELKSKTLQTLLDHARFDTLALTQQHRALVLAALLRMADGLDFRHTGSTQIVATEERTSPRHEIMITVVGPVAGSDAERANYKADLWARIFSPVVHFQTPPLSSSELLAHLLQLPEAATSSEAITLPATPGLALDDTLAEAARKTFLFHFQRMLYLEPTTRLGEDNEALHDMRVATRRMRTAAQVFAAYLDGNALQPYVKGLRRAGDALGAVRDLDVFWEKTELFLGSQEETERPDLTPLQTAWQEARNQARANLITYLDSNAYRRFRERFAAYLESPWISPTPPLNTKGEALPQRVRHVAPVIIVERVAAVRAYDPWMRAPDAPLSRYHRLRIASKRLRYTLEYFIEILGPAAKPLINQVKLLQDHLGDLQDAVVASSLLRDFLIWGTWGRPSTAILPTEPIVAPGVAAYLTARQLELQKRRDSFLMLWENFCSTEFSRLIGDTVAAL